MVERLVLRYPVGLRKERSSLRLTTIRLREVFVEPYDRSGPCGPRRRHDRMVERLVLRYPVGLRKEGSSLRPTTIRYSAGTLPNGHF